MPGPAVAQNSCPVAMHYFLEATTTMVEWLIRPSGDGIRFGDSRDRSCASLLMFFFHARVVGADPSRGAAVRELRQPVLPGRCHDVHHLRAASRTASERCVGCV